MANNSMRNSRSSSSGGRRTDHRRAGSGRGSASARRGRKNDRPSVVSIILAVEMTVLTLGAAVFFLYTVFHSGLLNTRYDAALIAFCVVIVAVVGFLGWMHAFNRRIGKGAKRGCFIGSVVLTVFAVIVFIIGGLYVYRTEDTLREVTGTTIEISSYAVYVSDDDPAQTLEDTRGYTYGILQTQDRENIDIVLSDIRSELGATVSYNEYPGLIGIADAMRSGEIQAMLIGSSFTDTYESFEGYETFSSEIRPVWSTEVTVELQTEVPEHVEEENEHVFTLYISGSDTRNSTLPSRGLSDVNLIVRMNTETHQILILNTPRDYYVPTTVSNGALDKLTQAGDYGVLCSMGTLAMLYGIDIDYYARVNFVGFTDIINAVGGVNVWSDYTFDTQQVVGYHFNEGYNYMTGDAALAFARERYAVPGGDNQRGVDQMHVLEGLIDKLTDPSVLTRYLDILDGLEGTFESNVPYDVMTELVQMQLDYGGGWEVYTYAVKGTGDMQPTYTAHHDAYVTWPDYSTVEFASQMLNAMVNDEVITDPDLAEGM